MSFKTQVAKMNTAKSNSAELSLINNKNIGNLTFIKWAGGKKQLISQIAKYLPKKIEHYYEPFIGGGALFFFILQKFKPKYAYLSDMNEELIISYRVIRDNINELIKLLEKHKISHNKEYYYKIRDLEIKNLNNIEIAARLIYLNKTCFNGLYRVNSKGKFNVPIGSYKNPNILDEERLRKISEILNQNVEIAHGDFSRVKDKVRKDSFVYFDPPYYPLDKKNSFTTYTKEDFLEKEQESLCELFNNLNKKKIKLMLSNSDTKFIKELYKKYYINLVYAKRAINCNGKKRGEIPEVLVTNY